jgi:hypothetical protein
MPATASTAPTSSSQVVAGRAILRKRAGFAKACTGRAYALPISLCAIASATDAGSRPDLQSQRNAFDPLANQARVAIAEIFGADVDDAAGVDHVVRRIENAAFVEALAV